MSLTDWDTKCYIDLFSQSVRRQVRNNTAAFTYTSGHLRKFTFPEIMPFHLTTLSHHRHIYESHLGIWRVKKNIKKTKKKQKGKMQQHRSLCRYLKCNHSRRIFASLHISGELFIAKGTSFIPTLRIKCTKPPESLQLCRELKHYTDPSEETEIDIKTIVYFHRNLYT